MFVFLAIVGLSVLIFFHELGHFVFAKIFKIKVEEFGIGYPPRLLGFIFFPKKERKNSWFKFWKKERSRVKFFFGKKTPKQAKEKTIYSLNWIPFGGFNKIKGELGDNDSPDSFYVQAWWKKAIVAMGGVLLNIVLAIILFSFCYLVGLPQDVDNVSEGKIIKQVGVQVGMVYPDSPAEKSELKIGDVIVSIEGEEIDSVKEVQSQINSNINNLLEIKIKRKEEVLLKTVEVVPAIEISPEYEENEGAIGIGLSNTAIVSYSLKDSILKGFKTTFVMIGQIFTGIWMIFKSIFTKGKMAGELLGPVGITAMASEMAQVGFIYFIQFIGILSVAIGAFQMIPFPGLDGSRVLFSIIEGIKGKPLKKRTEMILMNFGFYILLFVLLYVTFKEIIGFF